MNDNAIQDAIDHDERVKALRASHAELLAALESFVSWAESPPDTSNPYRGIGKEIDQSRAAIAKAREL